ncbi:unnamed protein product, partial [Ixodes pacificus]
LRASGLLGEPAAEAGHVAVEGPRDELVRLEVSRHACRPYLDAVHEGLEVGMLLQAVWGKQQVLGQHLVGNEVHIDTEVVESKVLVAAQEVREGLEGGGQALEVVPLQLVPTSTHKVRVVAEADPVHAEVGKLLLRHVHPQLLGPHLTEAMLPGEVAQDGHALGDLHVPVQVVGQLRGEAHLRPRYSAYVWELETQVGLVLEPGTAVEVRRRPARVALVLHLHVHVGQQETDGLCQ